VNNAVARAAGLLAVAVLPLAAGIGTGDLTVAADLAPTYRNALMICAALMVGGAALAATLIPARLQPHTPTPEPAAPPPEPTPAAASPIRTYCDIAGPPVHPRSEQ
jgi:hypothetical protein